jgi:phosphotransferase system HPr-like phosphotransfer protein
VSAELDGKKADAKDVEALCALGITPTANVSFDVSGDDSEQALKVLEKLVKHCFYVESAMGTRAAE